MLPFPVGAMYVRRHFDHKLIQLVTGRVYGLRFKITLVQMTELSEGLKNSFIETLRTRSVLL